MRYNNVIKAEFISRENRFIAYVRINGVVERVHVKNTGRCRELLVPGATVYLDRSDVPTRRTAYDLIAVEKATACGMKLINMDSMSPNSAVAEWLPDSGLFGPDAHIRREYTYGDSRFDFYVEDGDRRALIEVKGVTLEDGGAVSFPDAPTKRGVKHLRGLAEAIGQGLDAYVLFIVQMDGVGFFRPNEANDPEFAEELRRACSAGVKILAYSCSVLPDEMNVSSPLEVRL